MLRGMRRGMLGCCGRWRLDDPSYGQITMEVSELLRGDSDGALFQVPADQKMVG
jgi:hypothetical protein